MKIKELDLYRQIEKTGPFANEVFYREILISDWTQSRKRIDLVSLQNHDLLAIEVKVNDWKTALQQAYSNLYVADYSYVALWHQTIPHIDLSIFQGVGIGILEINGSCIEKLRAKKSKLVISNKKQYAKNQCLLQEIDEFVGINYTS